MPINRVQAVPLSSINAAGINAVTFTPINANGLPNPCFVLRVINASNTPVSISYDGINSHDYVAANSDIQIPAQSNSTHVSNANFGKRQIVSVAGTPGVGFIYLAGYYLQERT